MNIVPARWMSGDDIGSDELPTGALKPIIPYSPPDEGIAFECVVDSPSSAQGRKVYVHIRNDEVEWLMKELREVAIRRRSKPEVSA